MRVSSNELFSTLKSHLLKIDQNRHCATCLIGVAESASDRLSSTSSLGGEVSLLFFRIPFTKFRGKNGGSGSECVRALRSRCPWCFFARTRSRYYRKRGSASYIVREVLSVRERERERYRQRERETERDGCDVTIVALKLAMNLHSPLPKIRTIGDELTLSFAKSSHFSFLPSHFPSLPSRRGHHNPCTRHINQNSNDFC